MFGPLPGNEGAFIVCLLSWVLLFNRLSGYRADGKLVHDVHAVLVTALGLASLLQLGSGGGGGGGGSVDSRGVGWVHEMHVWTFSATYFCVDTVDAVRGRRWQMVVAHHSPSLALFVSNLLYPRIMELFYVSRILIIEVSTPLLTRWRRTRRRAHFMQFMLVFFVVRVLYLTWLGFQFARDFAGWPALQMVAWVLPVVNVYWFSQQAKMLFNYVEDAAKTS